jgi:hypothetical protein
MRLALVAAITQISSGLKVVGFIACPACRDFKTRWGMKHTLETTLGDLIVALTEETDRQVRDEKMSYEIVAYILADLMKEPKRTLQRA